MANVHSFHSVGDSIIKYLRNLYPDTDVNMPDCQFQLVSSGDLQDDMGDDTTLTLYIYRVTYNEFLRNSVVPKLSGKSTTPLSLDLHFMISIWTESAVAEHTVCAWVMQQLHQHPILDVSSLTPDGGWEPGDVVQIVPAELSNEDLMRIWDAFAPDYRLSVSYTARSIRIDPEEVAGIPPVVATRFDYSKKQAESNSEEPVNA